MGLLRCYLAQLDPSKSPAAKRRRIADPPLDERPAIEEMQFVDSEFKSVQARGLELRSRPNQRRGAIDDFIVDGKSVVTCGKFIVSPDHTRPMNKVTLN